MFCFDRYVSLKVECLPKSLTELIDPISLKYNKQQIQNNIITVQLVLTLWLFAEKYECIIVKFVLLVYFLKFSSCIILYDNSYCPTKEMLIDSFKTEGKTPDVCLTVFTRVKLKILFLYHSKKEIPTVVLNFK